MVVDLDAYFSRIGVPIQRSPSLAALNAIVLGHTQAIPFENLDVLLGRRIDLDLAAVQRKLVTERRGGYCFEQNGLLLGVLEALGFEVRPLSARVRYQRPRDFTPPRTHLLVRVELDGASWLADVGIGGLSLTAALRLEMDTPQVTPHDTRRLVREGDRLFHQVSFGGEWQDVCELTLEEMPPIDREVANWFTSTHPSSHFKDRLIVARALPDGGRVTLVDRELTHRRRGGASETLQIGSPDQLIEALGTHFDLRLPPEVRFASPGLAWTP